MCIFILTRLLDSSLKMGLNVPTEYFFVEWERWPSSLTWQPWIFHRLGNFRMKPIIWWKEHQNSARALEENQVLSAWRNLKASVRFPSSLDRGEIWTWRVKTPKRRGGAADIRAAVLPQEEILDLHRVRAEEDFSKYLFVEGTYCQGPKFNLQ